LGLVGELAQYRLDSRIDAHFADLQAVQLILRTQSQCQCIAQPQHAIRAVLFPKGHYRFDLVRLEQHPAAPHLNERCLERRQTLELFTG